MRRTTSEIILNVLKFSFPQSPDSKLARLAWKLQRKLEIEKQKMQQNLQMLSAQKGEEDMAPTLLFVDDNRVLAETATQYMNEIRPQWRFLLAHSLAEARRIYNQNCPDAAVLDVQLPDGSGLDLLSEFKLHRPSLPVIIISGDDPVTISQAVIERGGYSFLPKPFSAPILISHIESAIATFRDEVADQAEPRRESGGAWKNPHALALRSEGQKIEGPEPEDLISKRLFLK